MKKCMKKLTMLLLIVCMGLVFSNNAKAAPDVISNGVKVTNITSTSAKADWSDKILEIKGLGWKSLSSVDVTIWSANYGTQVLGSGVQASGVSLTNLAPGTDYSLEIKFYGIASDGNSAYDYACAWFRTDGATNLEVIPGNPTIPGQDQNTSNVPTNVPVTAGFGVSQALLTGDTLQVLASGVPAGVDQIQWQVVDKNGNVVKDSTSYSTTDTIYGLSSKKIYGVRCRVGVYDANYNLVYSDWSPIKYVISQPTITSKKKDIQSHKLTVKFKKISGAKDYTIYMRKHGSKSWTKIKTTKSNKLVITKFKKKTLTINSNGVDVCVIANAKIANQNIHSEKYGFTNFYVIHY